MLNQQHAWVIISIVFFFLNEYYSLNILRHAFVMVKSWRYTTHIFIKLTWCLINNPTYECWIWCTSCSIILIFKITLTSYFFVILMIYNPSHILRSKVPSTKDQNVRGWLIKPSPNQLLKHQIQGLRLGLGWRCASIFFWQIL